MSAVLRSKALATSIAMLMMLAAAPAAAGVDVPRFVDESEASGLVHVNSYVITPESPGGGWEFIVGGGLAAFDCDDDGRMDVYLAGGSSPASLYHNTSEPRGQIRFERIADDTTDLVQVSGAYPIDVDADGVADLAVLRRGENVVLRGLGECRFERANEAWNIDGGSNWTTAFSATWEDDSTLPTLAFGNYQALDASGELIPGACADQQLFRPDVSGRVYAAPIDLSPGWCTLSMLFSDWDRSGRRDLRISNDRQYYVDAGEEQLWRTEPEQPPRLYTAADGWERLMIFGMGIASHDIDADGYPEVYLTNMGNNKLQTLADGPGQPSYRDIAKKAGALTARPVAGDDRRPSTAWHPEFQDVNNDGLIDLYVSKGNIDAMPEHAIADPSSLLLGKRKGRFVERAPAAGIANMARARGAALVDLNDDGLLDLIEVNLGEPTEVWRNVGSGTGQKPRPMGRWLAVSLEQDGGNHDAVGSWIEVEAKGRTQLREVTIGGGHAGGQLGPHHFGLGGARKARVRVRWPDGEYGPWLAVAADTSVVVSRGAESALELEPART